MQNEKSKTIGHDEENIDGKDGSEGSEYLEKHVYFGAKVPKFIRTNERKVCLKNVFKKDSHQVTS